MEDRSRSSVDKEQKRSWWCDGRIQASGREGGHWSSQTVLTKEQSEGVRLAENERAMTRTAVLYCVK